MSATIFEQPNRMPIQTFPLRAFQPYTEHLEELAFGNSPRDANHASTIANALNGGASAHLKKVVSIERRRELGSFFTGEGLAEALLGGHTITGNEVFCDPTCGAGDLLLGAARILPAKRTTKETLRLWGHKLAGYDLCPEFVRATRARLTLLARLRSQKSEPLGSEEAAKLLSEIRVANALGEPAIAKATVLLMNPPFGRTLAPDSLEWGSGLVNAAALFFAHIVAQMSEGTRIYAILPEVLRTGSRYGPWRAHMSNLIESSEIASQGIFDSTTDVHVFRISASRIAKPRAMLQWTPKRPKETIADLFDVSVGTVVPFRDPELGPIMPFLHAKGLGRWTTERTLMETRNYSGRGFEPPFVVIRRTSRPEDEHRAVATLITGKIPVAVENHLIVCTPKSRKFRCCKRLMEHLRRREVSEFLNERIACRHLTVGAVRDIPYQ